MVHEVKIKEHSSSLFHSAVQTNLIYALGKYRQKYRVLSQPTLLLNNWESEPDIAIFPQRQMSWIVDEIKIKDVPLVCIEIISPRQGGQDLKEKFVKYFEAQVKSCWLVNPLTETIHIYYPDWKRETYATKEQQITDNSIQISIDFQEVFA